MATWIHFVVVTATLVALNFFTEESNLYSEWISLLASVIHIALANVSGNNIPDHLIALVFFGSRFRDFFNLIFVVTEFDDWRTSID